MTECFNLWAIYDHPEDCPSSAGFVARRWEVAGGETHMTLDILTAPTLEELRSKLPPGLYRLDRFPDDDAKIVETWL